MHVGRDRVKVPFIKIKYNLMYEPINQIFQHSACLKVQIQTFLAKRKTKLLPQRPPSKVLQTLRSWFYCALFAFKLKCCVLTLPLTLCSSLLEFCSYKSSFLLVANYSNVGEVKSTKRPFFSSQSLNRYIIIPTADIQRTARALVVPHTKCFN